MSSHNPMEMASLDWHYTTLLLGDGIVRCNIGGTKARIEKFPGFIISEPCPHTSEFYPKREISYAL